MPIDFIGQTFGSYKIVAQLGRGGMASVYRGYQESIDRSVAIKILPPELMHDPNFSARFHTEARTLAKLTHPSILSLYDFGTANNVPYIVMPLMSKGTLAERLRQPLSLAEVVRVLIPVAAALDYAHQQSVLHRDVKPSNILFDQNDTPFLGDFGIAKALESSSNLTGTGIIGTPDYMSPEQARGETIDSRADIYSLGVVAYQALSGSQLFKATTPIGVMLMHATEPPPPIRNLRPDLPQAVNDVIQKALAKYPAERYQTASDFATALTKAAYPNAETPTLPQPPSASEVTLKTSTVSPTPQASPPLATGPRTPLQPMTPPPMTRPLSEPPLPLSSTAAPASAPPKRGGISGMILGGGIGVMAGIGLAILALCGGAVLCVYAVGSISTPTPVPTNTPVPTDTPEPTSTPEPVLDIFFDDFSHENSGWGTFESDSAEVRYMDGEMSIRMKQTQWFAWSTINRSQSSPIHIEFTARNVGGSTDSNFGAICTFSDADNFTYLAIDEDGYYAIFKTNPGGDDILLTNGGEWATSALIPLKALSYQLGADCGGGTLALYVNGNLIDAVFDDTYTRGDVGVFVWTAAEVNAEFRFDDFIVSAIP